MAIWGWQIGRNGIDGLNNFVSKLVFSISDLLRGVDLIELFLLCENVDMVGNDDDDDGVWLG